MQYPGTIDKWFDHSGIQPHEIVEVTPRPLMLHAAAFERGPEKMMRVHGEDFYKLFGYYIDVEKYGQAGIQAANIIDNGGELLLKRVVADDATLGNIVVVANVSQDRVQKTNSLGQPLYLDPSTGKETTEAGDNNEAVMINVAKIKHELVTVPNAKNMNDVVDAALDCFVEDEDEQKFAYPLFVITDNGRGETTKRFGIEPMYSVSKNSKYMLYRLKYLGSQDLDAEQVYFALAPGIIYLDESMDIAMACDNMLQCNAKSIEDAVEAFYAKISEISGIEPEDLFASDVIFCKNSKGAAMTGLSLDDSGEDLSVSMGFALQSGSNGAFGDCPIETDEYEQALLDFFGGKFDSDIYNLDRFKIDVCVDANYPYAVKKEIVRLANFRKDFFFFGDLGLEVETYENAMNKLYEMPRSFFCGWYGQSYEIKNPFNKKNVRVTIGYSIARLVIPQLNNNTNAPYCGILYNFIIPEAIEGTVNWTPKITPDVNQKTLCDDARLNYASILQDRLTLETEFTAQEELTQLSFLNNVIAIQYIVKDCREQCPAYRYSFISTNDLSEYKKNVGNIISKYNTWFESLEFVYVQDEIMKANKIFEADIKFKHKDFVQSELFNLYVLGTDTAKEASADTSATEIANPYV